MKVDKDRVERLRKDLPTIRAVAGWSAEYLAETLDVTRQTIFNLENKKTAKMTVIQYLAIRSLLDDEIKTSKNDTLAHVINIFVDNNLPEDKLQELRDQIKGAVKSVGRRAGSQAIGKKVIMKISHVIDYDYI